MHRLTRGLTRLIPNSSESNSHIILFSSFHRSNPIQVDKLAATFPILHRTYTKRNPSSRRPHSHIKRNTPSRRRYYDLVQVVRTGDGDGGGGIGIGASVYERKELPEGLAKHVVKLTCASTAEGGVCDVYVVGTSHVSPKSCQEVQAVISFLKPQVVFLELCSSRAGLLTENFKVGMYGGEFCVGFNEAIKYGGKVILGDRPIKITLWKKWARLSLWDMTKFITFQAYPEFFIPELIKDIKREETDELDMIRLLHQETSKRFPTYTETTIHERDKYMSSTLLRVASVHNSVVAIVGRGHLDGIRKHWKEPVEIKDLLEMPVSKLGVTVKKILIFFGVGSCKSDIMSGIIAGIFHSSKK